MTDPRVDALIRRLDVRHEPPAAVVETTFIAIEPVADRARRRDGGGVAALSERIRAAVRPPFGGDAQRRAFVLVVAMLATALLVLATGLMFGARTTTWTPSHVVFGRFNDETNAWDILTIRVDGSGERSLLAGAHDVTRVSHDGRRLASATIGSVVFPTIIDNAGTPLLELHPDPTLNLGAMAWSRDDRWLAFEGWDEADPSRDGVYLMRADGTNLRRLTFRRGIPGDFSPDDTSVVFSREGVGLFVVNVDGSGERQIGSLLVDTPGFLPDGHAVYASVDGALWRIALDSAAATMIVTGSGEAAHPRLSPDGTSFVFSLHELGGPSRGIWTVDIDGSGLRKLVDAVGINEGFPDWLP